MNDSSTSPTPEETRARDRRIAGALGLFLAVMSLLLLVAVPFATLTIDRVLQLACALVLALVAAIFFRASRSR